MIWVGITQKMQSTGDILSVVGQACGHAPLRAGPVAALDGVVVFAHPETHALA